MSAESTISDIDIDAQVVLSYNGQREGVPT